MQDLRLLADVISRPKPDIVALQEVRCEFTSRTKEIVGPVGLNEPRELARLTAMNYVFGSALDDLPDYPANTGYLEWSTNGADDATSRGPAHGEYGNALLTRLSIEAPPESFPLPNREKKEQRICLRVVLGEETTGRLVVYVTHLQHDSADLRVEQLAEILKHAAGEKQGTTVLLMGDFNVDAKQQGNLMEQALREGFHDLPAEFAAGEGRDPALTFPADHPDRRIDYILSNKALKVMKADTIDSLASDHRPLFVEVELPGAM